VRMQPALGSGMQAMQYACSRQHKQQ
jgi:hypothetical protein